MTEGQRLVAEALLDAEKSNAENVRKARINEALESMIGQPLNPSNGNALAPYTYPIPDFMNIAAPPPYAVLRQIIIELEAAGKALSDSNNSLNYIERRPEEIIRLNNIARRFSDSKLSPMGVITLIGAFEAAAIATLIARSSISVRLTELLEVQRAHYPEGKGRKKNAHAYLVAEKLARFYANRCKKKPSFGTGDSGIPSTDYARALERIFGILGIKAALRGPAEAAIAGLTPADLNPPPSLFNALGGVFSPQAN